ncbi:MAG TPA: FAD-dependent oxidoreductase [Gemmatimonadaceae bacterium]
MPASRDAPHIAVTPASRLSDRTFDVLVAGAGITGACIALDASARGLRVALIDRGDYAGGATANCLRIVHGGLRYLQHLDLRRARESIRERRLWLRAAPHLVEPLPTVVPTVRGVFPSRSLLVTALAANDLLSADRNSGVNQDRRLPAFQVLSREETRRMVPLLDDARLTGGVLFHDAVMYSPERLTLEVIEAARIHGAVTANHTALVATRRDHAGFTSTLRDAIAGDEFTIRSTFVVNATGAHVNHVARILTGAPPQRRTKYSLALNLVTSRPWAGPAFAIAGGGGDPDRVIDSPRRLFVVPWRGQQLVGTAHAPFHGDESTPTLPDELVEGFVREVNGGTPAVALTPDDVKVVQWGLLPVAGDDTDRVRLLKQHAVVSHAAEGVPGAWSVVSIKFTNARHVAADVVNRLTSRRTGIGGVLPLPGRLPGAVSDTVETACRAHPDVPADVVEHLVRSYGTRFGRVIELARLTRGGFDRLHAAAPVIAAQLAFGASDEEARTEDDLLWRRTELGARGLITSDARRAARAVLGTDGVSAVIGSA